MRTPDTRIVLQGTFELVSALKIASGDGEFSDSDIILDSRGLPFIPGTALAGVLKSKLLQQFSEDKKDFEKYWGLDNTKPSDVDITSCPFIGTDIKAEIRDGVFVKSNGTVENKFDYQVVPAGAKFGYRITFNIFEKEKISEKVAELTAQILENCIRVGGKTTKGLGELKIAESNNRIFDFSNIEHTYGWIDADFENGGETYSIPNKIELSENIFSITANFKINNSLIIGNTDITAPTDKSHIKSTGSSVFKGTSLVGALRKRAMMICQTVLDEGKANTIVNNLFGSIEGSKIKSRFEVNEVKIDDTFEQTHHRIKINRITGGTIDGAKFDSTPLYTKDKDSSIKSLRLSIKNPQNHEIGLALLLLKDLFCQDLPVGGEKGIGRGTLIGVKAIIENGVQRLEIGEGFEPSKDGEKEVKALQEYVKDLRNYKPEKVA